MRGEGALPIGRLLTALFAPYTGFVVLVAMLFGGGAEPSDAVVELAALPLLAWSLYYLSLSRLSRSAFCAFLLLCAILALPLLQLIPLPPALWVALPGRKEIATIFTAAGLELPWLPISLSPAATWRAMLSLLPAAAVFMAMLSLGQRARRRLIVLVLVIAFVSVVLDLLQLMGGQDSSLRFYAITNSDRSVGFFANVNHNAAFLYCVIVFAAAWAIGLARDHRKNRATSLALLFFLLVMVIIALAVTRSRAGLALGFVAGLLCILLVWRQDSQHTGRRMLFYTIGLNVIALVIAFQFGFVGFMQRMQQSDVIEDLRWPVAEVTTQAAIAYMPFGSGYGTFVPIYQKFAPRQIMIDRYINHAHDDWLELWLTGGAPAILLILCYLAWFIAVAASLWRGGPPGTSALDLSLMRAASIVVVLLLLHSAVDYPLRTGAMSVLFAMACAFMTAVHKPDVGLQAGTTRKREAFHPAPGVHTGLPSQRS